jgi:hypothetical protein
LQVAGNPFGEVWSGKQFQGDVRTDIGAYAPSDVDIALPAAGFSWVVGRTYNSQQQNTTPAHIDSNGYQGRNWFQTSQPEILLYEHPSDDAEDVLYLVYGADRFVEFKRADESSVEFKGVNGAAGAFVYASGGGGPDTWTLTDQNGNVAVFFGFDGDADPAEGQLWKITDPDGNVAYVGHASTAATALSSGYDADGRILKAYDSSGNLHRFTHTYTTLDGTCPPRRNA